MERGQLHSRGPAEMLGGVARSVIGRDGFDPQSVGHPRRPPERPCGSPTPSARQAGSVESETLTYILRLSFYVLMYSSTDGVSGDSKSLDAEIMDGAYYSNFGGAVIRHGEDPDVLGVLEAPDNHMPIGIAFQAGGTAEGLALFRLQVHKADLPGRWVCLNRWFVRVEG
jgi:hypothetical protein